MVTPDVSSKRKFTSDKSEEKTKLYSGIFFVQVRLFLTFVLLFSRIITNSPLFSWFVQFGTGIEKQY